MKQNCRPLKPVALLLLLLGLSLGGWGLLSVVFPELAPAWWAAAPGRGGDGETGAGIEGMNGNDGTKPEAAATAGRGKWKGGEMGEERYFDPKALPRGLTSIDGEGGTGLNRAVKKNGVWFPVYSPGPNPGNGPPPLTVIPLAIASGGPPPGRVNQTFSYQAEAIGGTAPYTWTATMEGPPGLLALGLSDGLLAGMSKDPVRVKVDLTVTDAAGTADSVGLTVVIKPEQDLKIDNGSIPLLSLGAGGPDYFFRFSASGGVPPYIWQVTPGSLVLYEDGIHAGAIQGVIGWPGEKIITVSVRDAQRTLVEKQFLLRVGEGLEITTESTLPPFLPGRPYRGTFAALGGVPPYQWELGYSSFPDKSWTLSPDGVLSGSGNSLEQIVEFTVLVQDAEEATYEKKFRLAGGDFLTAVPSREKVGLAWVPRDLAALLSGKGLGAGGFRVLRDGVPVYEGTGNNFVDRGVASGSIPRYTLVALVNDGTAQPVAEKEVAVLPQSLTRAEPGVTGDPFADRVVSFRPLSAGGYGASGQPRNVTGPPDGRSTYSPAYKPGEVLSLHARAGAGGSVELEFIDNIVEIAPGEDLTVFENVLFVGGNGNQRFMEPAVISVALFPGEWHRLSCDVVPPAAGQALDLKDPFYYARGIAGRNGTTGSDPTNPNTSGGDSFDLDEVAARAGLTWIRYIKIQSTGDATIPDDTDGDLIRHTDDPAFNPLSGSGSSGFDLDAVSAVHY